MVIFKGFYIIDSNGIIIKRYFEKRNKTYHERVRIMRGFINYWGLTDIVKCGFINRCIPNRKNKPIKWIHTDMSFDAFKIICEELEKQGILKKKGAQEHDRDQETDHHRTDSH